MADSVDSPTTPEDQEQHRLFSSSYELCAKLTSLLAVMSNEFEAFDEWDYIHKHNMLWAAKGFADQLFSNIERMK